MAGQEEEEAGKWTLRPCSFATVSSYKEGDRPPEGWIDVYREPASPSFNPFGSQRRAAAIDKLLQDAKLPAPSPAPAPAPAPPVAVQVMPSPSPPVAVKQAPAAAPAPPGDATKLKRRLTKGEIMSIIALKPEPFPSADYLDDLAQFEPPEVIAEKRRQHEADAAYFGDRDEQYEAFRQKVIRGLKEDGYYEVDEDFLAARKKSKNPRIPFAFLDPADREGFFATPEDHERRLREGCVRQYVPDAEDALLISYGDDDSTSDDVSASDEEEDDDEAPNEAN